MTTIIAVDGNLYTDRRKVINHTDVGIVGAEEGDKAVVTPFCIYSTAGFDLYKNKGMVTQIEKNLALIFGLTQLVTRNYKGTSLVSALLRKIPGSFSAIRHGRKVAMHQIDTILENERTVLIAVTKTHVYTADGITASHLTNFDSCRTFGSAAKSASILLANGEPIDEVYRALRGGGAPTGSTYDVYPTSQLDDTLMPPVCNSAFTAAIAVATRTLLRMDKASPEKDKQELLSSTIQLICLLISLGDYNRKTDIITYTESKDLLAKLTEDFRVGSNLYEKIMTAYKEEINE